MRQQIRNPRRIIHIGLAPRDIADVLRVRQHQLETLFEHMPHRLPIYPRGLHRHVGHSMHAQPFVEFKQRRGRRPKISHLIMPRFAHTANPGKDTVLVDIKARATRIQHFHRSSLPRLSVVVAGETLVVEIY